jgi:mRNA-degrading endonuclease toxin of MazEF toxin-antitoxin module
LPPRQGEIWYVNFPNQPNDPHQPRRALVISENVRNFSPDVDDYTVIPIFSEGALGPTRVQLSEGIGGIDHDSVLFCEEITTLFEEFFGDGPAGPPVPRAIIEEVQRAVRRSLGELVP